MDKDLIQTAEADLLAEFSARRSEEAFAELIRRHMPMVFGVCQRVLEDSHAAEDAAQAVFLVLAKKAGSLGRERGLAGWLHHVALCTARNDRKARERRARREQEAIGWQPCGSTESHTALRESLDRELDALPDKYRLPLVMVHLEGRTLEETAAALKCKDGTLRVWLSRACEKLRGRLAKRGVSVSMTTLAAWMATQSGASAAVPASLSISATKGALLWASGSAAGIASHIILTAETAMKAMFISKLKTAAVITATIAMITTASALSWKKVQEATAKGLPKTAIEEIKPIIADAMKNKRYAEAIKAICMKIVLEGDVEGGKAEEMITRLEAEISTAPAEMKPMMQAILANWYWHYFEQNRYRFQGRTQTAEASGKDITTWDLPRILAEVDKQFSLALAHEKELKATPVSQFDDLLKKGTAADSYRPTLFDFVAYEALEFYQAGEHGLAKAENEFEIEAQGPVFGTVEEFMGWQPVAKDTGSLKLKAIKLYQNLLGLHQADTDKSAWLDADLWRLNFGKNQAVGESGRYKAALKGFVEKTGNYEISARALYEWASVLHAEEDLAGAHELAKRGKEAYPQSYGGRMCHNLIQALETKEVNVSTERVWNAPWPTITLNYKNIEKAYFRVIPYDFEKELTKGDRDITSEESIRKLKARAVAASWEAPLPATSDYRLRTEKVAVPKDLKPGYYIVLVSQDAAFSEKNNQVGVAGIWVSDLALVIRHRHGNGDLDGFVLKAQTGEPVAGATVRSWRTNRKDRLVSGPETKTDANGKFRFSGNDLELNLLMAQKDGHSVPSDSGFHLGHREAADPSEQTVFFTDRSLYRPGQTIQFKGICYRMDTERNRYQTIGGRAVTVVLQDPNGREVGKQKLNCNDYGSFSGSFTAPSGGVTGEMELSVAEGPGGSTRVSVEEYKRPKFQVEMSAPKEGAKLGGEVEVRGKATAYTGAAIGGARVEWRVVRNMRFPSWCWWSDFCLPPSFNREDQNIAHGSITTQSDGSFDLRFVALPDLAVAEKLNPTFSYTVHADVTDTNGETRSGSQSVRVGYSALELNVVAEEWQTPEKPVDWTIGTKTLDGQPQSAEGTLRVYALKQPEVVQRAELVEPRHDYWWFRRNMGANGEPKPDPGQPESWELGELVSEQKFKTEENGAAKVTIPLKAGIYRAMVESKDRFGREVRTRQNVEVVDPKAANYMVRVPHHLESPSWSVEPGQKFQALWGTGYDKGRAYVELEHKGKVLRAYWTGENRTQEMIEQLVGEEMRGGFTLRVTYVRENRAYLESKIIEVPWTNKELVLKWEHFRSKMEPGKKETWSAVVTGRDARKSVAEMVATLYDASLDQFRPHAWAELFSGFQSEEDRVELVFVNQQEEFETVWADWPQDSLSQEWTYRQYPEEIHFKNENGEERMEASGIKLLSERSLPKAAPMAAAAAPGKADGTRNGLSMFGSADKAKAAGGEAEPPAKGVGAPDLSKVSARKNLNETAFFFPHLASDAEGVVRMEFTMPEALTEWKFMGFAHDRDLRSGFLGGKAVTSKDLMVQPNPPRFVREGDVIEFTVKVSNQSASRQSGKVKLSLSDARTLKSVDVELGNEASEQEFDIAAKESKSFSWRLSVPDGTEFLTYKAVGATERQSDGEEGYLPVLSRRILVTESMPLPIRGAQTKEFELTKLLESGKSATLKNQSLTVQMVSQPAWYAVMALPYLMEYPYECSEQTFNRLYANALARHIANSDPKIRRIFDLWKNTPALESPLEKNQDLKSLLIEETPWLSQAKSESQARRNVGILFDENRLDQESGRVLEKLANMQLEDGLWPWFPGGRGDQYISLYITTGFGRMRHLGVEGLEMDLAIKSLDALDAWMDQRYRDILKGPAPEDYVPGSLEALYLYGRSFFIEDKPVEKKAALEFYLKQARKFWLKVGSRQSQGHLAIGLKRFGDKETPAAIMKSIKEFSVSNEEMGMFWRDSELSWWWYRAPIETQALMIEAFDEVMGDAKAVEDCRVWLLKQKQTQDWKTTKATADAVYGLLLRGKNMLASDALVEVSLGGEMIKPEKVEAGTGFYEQKFVRGEIKPDMGKITVKKTDAGVSWGSVHWQYLEDMTKVTPYEGTPLKLKKTFFRKDTTQKGQVLEAVKGPLAVGDELVCRIELRVDRDMEYVHLKDQRGSGTEPVNVLSQNKFQDGLAYYESTRDTASHFFIHYLPKGVYVFEYSVRVQLKGKYQSGMASIQSMYAPEFNSHSESVELEVK